MCPGSCLLCSDVTFGTLDNLEEILKNGNELEVMIPEQPVPQQQATANPVQSGQISPVCVTQKVYTVIVPTKARQSNTVQQPVPQASTDVDAIAAAAELEKREEREEIWLELEKRERRDLVEQERRASAKEFEERQRNVSTSSSSSIPTVTPDTGARTKVVSTSSSGASGVTGKPRGVQSGQISTEAQRPRPGSNLCKASTDVDAIAAAAELEKRARRERRDLVEQERRAAAKEFEERQRKVDDSGFSSLYSGVSTEDEDLLNDSKSVHGAVSENSQNQENEDMDDGGPNQPDNDGDNASGITLKNSITAIRR